MRHGRKFNHLGRKSAHRNAMLANMAASLIFHKRITTTVAKAKALRKYVEPLITKSKDNTTHSRRVVFSYLKHKDPVKELFEVVGPKVGDRPGGYTRIIKTGYRLGDNAETCIIELVDFNEIYGKETKKKASRRSRRGSGSKSPATKSVAEKPATMSVEDVAEEPADTQAPKSVEEDVKETVSDEVTEEVVETNEEATVEEEKIAAPEVEPVEEPEATTAEKPVADAEEEPEAKSEEKDDAKPAEEDTKD